MSSFIWELEKLRRRLGLDDAQLKEAVKLLTRKTRGLKQQQYTGEITVARKKRRETLKREYLTKIAELAELLTAHPEKSSACTDSFKTVPLGYLILNDLVTYWLRQVSEDATLSEDDFDHIEAARFHSASIEGFDVDSPRRRALMRHHIQMLENEIKLLKEKTTP